MKFKIEDYPPVLIIGIIVFFVLLMDFLILLRPQLVLLGRTGGKASTLSRDLKAAKREIAAMESFRKRLEVLKEKEAVEGGVFVKEEEMPIVLESISKLAKQNYVKIVQMKPAREEERKVASVQSAAVYELPIYIEARCSYHQLGKFINKIENDNIFMNVAAFELLPNPDGSLQHKVIMVLFAYILK